MKKALAIVVLFFAFAQPVLATGPGSNAMFITGTVTDKTSNETIAGVQVRVQGTDIVTYTNFDGNFFLPELPKGKYTLEFSYITYTSEAVVMDGSNLQPQVEVALEQR
jgi:hypothetical protein